MDWGLVRLWLPQPWALQGTKVPQSCWGAHGGVSYGVNPLTNPPGVALAPCGSGGSVELTVTAFNRAAPAGGHPATINGTPVLDYPNAGLPAGRVIVPSLHAELTARTTAAAHLVATLQPSLADDFIHARLPARWPASWQQVTYQHLTIDTPRSWKVQQVGYEPCDALGQDFPAVLRGTPTSTSGCAGFAYLAVPTTHGAAWIDPGHLHTTIGPAITQHHHGLTLTMAALPASPAQVLIHITGTAHGTIILAIPPDTPTAAAVTASVRP